MAEIIYDSFDGSINPIKYFAKSPEAAAHTIGFKTRLTGSVFMSCPVYGAQRGERKPGKKAGYVGVYTPYRHKKIYERYVYNR